MKNVTFSNCFTGFGYLYYIKYQNKNQQIKLENITLSSIYINYFLIFNLTID